MGVLGEDGRFRLRHEFWLNLNRSDDTELADLIAQLKTKKSYTDTLRRGIRIDHDLQNGRLDALFALYPWVKALFQLGQGRGMPTSAPRVGVSEDDELALPITITTTSNADATDNFLDSFDQLEF